jgi:hypothetical protein
LQLHAIDFGQKAGDREPIVDRITLNVPQPRRLVLKMAYAFQFGFKLLVILDHQELTAISTIPRQPPPRFIGQYSTVACSFSFQIAIVLNHWATA